MDIIRVNKKKKMEIWGDKEKLKEIRERKLKA